MIIQWLDEPEAQNAELVGSKAAMLGKLYGRYQIPVGFCLPATIFKTWSGLDTDQPLPGPLQAELEHILHNAYQELAQRTGNALPQVAVRSSAPDEDGAVASFAGQYQTVLNVTGVEALVTAVLSCWRTAVTPAVLAYRQERGLPTDSMPFAILIQQMVDAEIAAVGFSVNPARNVQDEIVINANWGLGESIVSGTVTPDTYVLRKSDLTLLDHQLGEKAQMTVPTAMGTTTVDTPTARRQQAVLADAQWKTLGQILVALEAEMGWPVDAEFAFAQDHWYLLQCRPVTTMQDTDAQAEKSEMDLNTIRWDDPRDAEQTWSGGTALMKPLQQSMALYYYQGWAQAFRAVGATGGLRARFINGYEYRLWQFEPRENWAQVTAAQQVATDTLPTQWHEVWLPEIQRDLAQWRATDLTALTNNELASHLHNMLNRQLIHWQIHARMGSVPLDVVQRLIDWYLQRFPDAPESEPYQLLQSRGNVSVDANHGLWQLSRQVDELVAAALRSEEWTRLPTTFRLAWADWWEHYGDGLPASKTRAVQLILRYAEADLPDPAIVVAQLAADRAAFAATIRAKLTAEELVAFDQLLKAALAHNPLTEDHNLYLDQQSDAATRLVCHEFARRLVANGVLKQAEEIDYLTLTELIQWGWGLGNGLRSRIVERQAAYTRYAKWQPPRFIGKVPEPSTWESRFSGPATPLAADPGTLKGIGASTGIVSGVARVVRNLEEAAVLRAGEILVCPHTNPQWTPYFALAAALVTDQGGSLCHAAVVAREYRLPAVVGTHHATTTIQTGQRVEVDGMLGVVRYGMKGEGRGGGGKR